MPRRLATVIGWLGAACIVAGIALYVRQQASRQAQVAPAGGASPVDPSAEDRTPLPFDSTITTGTLENGLRYFVRANRQPLNRAELRLVVNAGSLLEEDDQLGLAHFVEHMAFNGTRRFPKQEIGAFLESIGMRFGPSVNAFTGFDDTTYALQIPTDDPAVLDRALMILEDWAHNVTFDPLEVDKERRVIVEEWRLRRGAAARIQDAQLTALLKGSRYADRLPIGTPESIQTFKLERLKQYYTDWYRPDLMAVVAVGDFDAAAMARRIEMRFNGVPAAPSPRPRPAFDVPPQPGTEIAVATDAEATSTNVALVRKRQPREAATVADYRRDTVERLALGALAARLTDIAQLPKGPFVTAAASRARLVRATEVVTMQAVVGVTGVLPALSALAVERERLLRFGVTAPELDRQKRNLLRGFERAIAERERQPSAALAAEYVRHATVGEPVPGLQWEFDTTSRLLPGITLDEVTAAARAALADDNTVVTIAAPRKTNVYVPATRELSAVLAAAKSAVLQPWVARVDTSPLLEHVPAPGSVTRTVTHEAIGVTEWRLSNGARVVLKPTDFKKDEVVLAAVSPGGLSLAGEANLVPAQTAVQVVTGMGFGRFGSGDLRRALTGKVVGVQPVIGPFEEGLSGGSSRNDLETLFQLIHLTMTAPRRDPTIFAAMQGQMRSALSNQMATPEFAFTEALSLALSQNHPRARPLRAEAVDRMDMDASLAFFRERFGNAADFTFVFAGSFTIADMRPLVERYLASLPATGTSESWKDTGVRPPRGVVERVVEKGIEPKSRTALLFTGPIAADRASSLTTGAMAEVLQTRLRDAIREEAGGTYSITVAASTARAPIGHYSVSIDFTGDPARMDALVSRVLDEVAAFKRSGPTPRQVQDVKAALLRDFESHSRQNAYVAGQLAQRFQTGDPPESVWQVPQLASGLTSGMIHEAAKQYLDTGNYVRVTLRPERR